MDITTIVITAALSFLAAGTIKGVVGIGLPSIAIALLVLALAPREEIALVMFPMIAANILQSYRAGHFIRTAKRYWLFALLLFLSVGTVTLLTKDMSDKWLLVAIGVAMIIFVIASWRNIVPVLRDEYDKASQIFFALFSGVIGGMTAAWGPPMAMYLMTRNTPKDEFIRATGFLILVGSLPLTTSYFALGFLDQNLTLISIAMIIPTFAGFMIGEKIRNRLSVVGFKNFVLVIFTILALNLFRRAFFGA